MVKKISLENREIKANDIRARITIPFNLIRSGELDIKKKYNVILIELED